MLLLNRNVKHQRIAFFENPLKTKRGLRQQSTNKILNMKKLFFLTAVGICATGIGFAPQQAQAIPITYDITFSGSVYTANGQITVDSGLATTGYLTVTAGNDLGTYQLFTPAGTVIPPAGSILSDNLVQLGSDPFLDSDGLTFTGTLFSGNHTSVAFSIWGNGPGSYGFVDDSTTINTQDTGTATITPVPDNTSTLGLLTASIGGLCLLKRKIAKNA